MSPRVLALIPAFNEAGSIEHVVRGAARHVAEVLVVDDGSGDETAARARSAGARVISHETNRGKAAALGTGFDFARSAGFDAVVTLDGDGQHDTAEIPRLLEGLTSGAGVVSGNRMADPAGMPWSRRVINRFTSWASTRITGQIIPDSQCGFRAIDVEVLRALNLRCTRFAGDAELVLMAALASFEVRSVPITCIYAGERSNIRVFSATVRLVCLALRATAIRIFTRRPKR